MDSTGPVLANERGGRQDDLRQRISELLVARLDEIAAEAAAIFPFSEGVALDLDYGHHISQMLVRLLAAAVGGGRLDPRGGFVADLHRVVLQRTLSMERLFTFTYLTERIALDDLALDETIGAMSEPWPLVAQLVRRASFDLLAAYTERARPEPSEIAITDRLTTLYTRPLFDAVLAKEVERAGRAGYPVSLILFDVDHVSAINEEHGYSVGDRILERIGILIRQHFRQHDWVARHSGDCVAVLLTRTDADAASDLADEVRHTIETRLGFIDHQTATPVSVTLSVAVVNVQVAVGDVIDPERFVADAEALMEKAKQHGRNRVERMDGLSKAPHTRG